MWLIICKDRGAFARALRMGEAPTPVAKVPGDDDPRQTLGQRRKDSDIGP